MVKNLIVECDLSTSKTADTVHTGIKHECLFSKFAAGFGCLYSWGAYIYGEVISACNVLIA